MSVITVLYFAAAKSAIGLHSEQIALPSTPYRLSALNAILLERHPNISLQDVLEICSWSVDATMIANEEVSNVMLFGGEEVAVIPPVSGG